MLYSTLHGMTLFCICTLLCRRKWVGKNRSLQDCYEVRKHNMYSNASGSLHISFISSLISYIWSLCTTLHVPRYLSNVSQNIEVIDRVKNLLIQSNPVLEAFGNAQTTRNDNSSRFVSSHYARIFRQANAYIYTQYMHALLISTTLLKYRPSSMNKFS